MICSQFPNVYSRFRGLTHGRIEGLTKSGRLVGTWNGALEEIKSKIKLSCENLTDRTGKSTYSFVIAIFSVFL
jgi:hypothetical protein